MRRAKPGWVGWVCVVALVGAVFPAHAQPRTLTADVLVYGATPQGVTAAVAAAFRGLRVVLAEPTPFVGGAFSQSWVNTFDLTWDSAGELLYGGLVREFVRRMGSYDGVEVRRAERILRDLLHAAGVSPRLGWRLDGVEVHRGRLVSATFSTPEGQVTVNAESFVDATDLAHLAAAAGARFTVGREDTGLDRRSMAASLVLRLRGLSWAQVSVAACPTRPCADGGDASLPWSGVSTASSPATCPATRPGSPCEAWSWRCRQTGACCSRACRSSAWTPRTRTP